MQLLGKVSRGSTGDVSPAGIDDASPVDRCDVSPVPRRDVYASPETSFDASCSAVGDTSPVDPRDTSPEPAGDVHVCEWCRRELQATARTDQRYCDKRCRQTAWRARRIAVAEDPSDTPKRLAYADPPFPGMAARYYRNESTYRGEVDHAALVLRLQTFDGWALSTSASTLRYVLQLCPPDVHVCAWVKPNGVSRKARGLANTWEPLIVKPARERQPGKRDWLSAKPARGGGKLMGRKPIKFCLFLFDALGASPVDQFDDLFPGTGVVGMCWKQFVVLGRGRQLRKH